MALSPTVRFVIAGVFLAVGLMWLFLAAFLNKTYWAFLTLVPMTLLAVPLVISPPTTQGEGGFFQSLSNFMVGVFFASIFGLIIVLRHVKAITTLDFILTLNSICFMLTAVVWIVTAVKSRGYSSY